MLNRMRASTITVFCAYILFVIAGLAFQKMTEYDDFTSAMQAHTALSVTYKIIVIGSAIAFLAVLIGGLPMAVDAAIHAYKTRRRDLLLLLAPPLSLLLLAASLITSNIIAPHIIFPDPRAIALAIIFMALFLLAAIASTAAVSLLVARHATNERLLRSGHLLAIVTTASMALMLIVTIIWGLILQAQDPQLFATNNGILGASTALTSLGIILLMALATVLAITTLLRSTLKQNPLASPVL